MLHPLSARYKIERDVQDVVGFMIGAMPLQKMEVVVDVADQADPQCQQEHATNSAGTEALDPIGELVVDVASGHHRLFAIGSRPILNAVEDSLLTFTQSPLTVFAGTPAGALWGFLGYSGSHSKASFE